MNIVENAYNIAKEAHKDQRRKFGSQEPYFVHPERCANLVKTLPGASDAMVAAAYTHDVLEDCGECWAARIEAECGADVLALVRELTFPCEGPEWHGRPREEKNLIRDAQMRRMTDEAKRLKMVDTLDNLRDSTHAPHKLRQKYKNEAYRRLEILGHVDPDLAKLVREAADAI